MVLSSQHVTQPESQLRMVEKHQSLTLVNDHIATAGISPFLLGNTVHLQTGYLFHCYVRLPECTVLFWGLFQEHLVDLVCLSLSLAISKQCMLDHYTLDLPHPLTVSTRIITFLAGNPYVNYRVGGGG